MNAVRIPSVIDTRNSATARRIPWNAVCHADLILDHITLETISYCLTCSVLLATQVFLSSSESKVCLPSGVSNGSILSFYIVNTNM
jgi:hypothetical protein